MTVILVALGTAIGAASRWRLDRFIQSRHAGRYPWGTFAINVAGSLALGALLAMSADGLLAADLVALLGTGLCGGFTTFSTFGFEAVRLTQEGSRRSTLTYVLGSVGVGLAAAAAGWYAVTPWTG